MESLESIQNKVLAMLKMKGKNVVFRPSYFYISESKNSLIITTTIRFPSDPKHTISVTHKRKVLNLVPETLYKFIAEL